MAMLLSNTVAHCNYPHPVNVSGAIDGFARSTDPSMAQQSIDGAAPSVDDHGTRSVDRAAPSTDSAALSVDGAALSVDGTALSPLLIVGS